MTDGPPLPGPRPPPVTLRRLKKRAEFLFVAQGFSAARGAIVIQARRRPEGDGDGSDAGVGFTATRKVGGAVVRNRAKRRMREAARLVLPAHAEAGCDYVFVARAGTAGRPWARFLDDVGSALISLRNGGDPPRSAQGRPSRTSSRQARSKPAPPPPADAGPKSVR
jgi:ribonuclease P protein component